MSEPSRFKIGFFRSLNLALELILLNLMFIITVIATSGVFFVIALTALFSMLIDFKEGRQIDRLSRYFSYLKAHIGFGLKSLLILIPFAVLAYMNVTAILYIGTELEEGFLSLILLFSFIFISLYVMIIFMVMFLIKAQQSEPITLRATFNFALFVVMKNIKRFIVIFVYSAFVVFLLWTSPFLILLGIVAFYAYFILYLFEKDTKIMEP